MRPETGAWMLPLVIAGAAVAGSSGPPPPDALLTRWAVPNMGFHIHAAGGVVFFTSTLFPYLVGRLDPTTNLVTRWSVPISLTSPGDIIIRPGPSGDLDVFVSDIPHQQIARLDPAQGLVTEWTIPFAGGPRDFAIDPSGDLYFSVWSTSTRAIGRLHSSSNTLTFWNPLALPPGVLGDVASDSSGNIFFSISNHTLVRLEPATGTFTAWTVRTSSNHGSVDVDSAGNVFLNTRFTVKRLVPQTNLLTEWMYPGHFSEFITIASGDEAFLVDKGTAFVRLDPSVPGADTTVTPTTFGPLAPTVFVVSPLETVVPFIESTAIAMTIPSTGAAATAFTSWDFPVPGRPRGASADLSGAVFFSDQSGAVWRLTPCEPNTCVEGGQGCTPGYWKQPHHFDDWASPYLPEQPFSTYFENAFDGKSLLTVLSQPASAAPGPNQLNSLGRHTVAALLNAASSGVGFDFTEQEVIGAFDAVYPGSNGAYNTLKAAFSAANEQGCPLGGSDVVIDVQDIVILVSNWGTQGPGDIDGDGIVTADDLVLILPYLQ